MTPAPQPLGALDKAEALQQANWLKSKGVNPKGQFQLDLLFPDSIAERDDLRQIPNDYARSSLFTARNKRIEREHFTHKQLFHYSESVTILYTGIELRAEDDELIWMQILSYSKQVPMGEPFEFSLRDLVRDVNWSKNGRYYDKARECISRLKANEVMALNQRAYGKSGAISLIQNYTSVNDEDGKPTQYRVWMDPGLVYLFAGNSFTNHTWSVYTSLSPVARRLTDHVKSHQVPHPLAIERFQGMCGSLDQKSYSWKQTVTKACNELMAAKVAKSVYVQSNFIIVVRD